ncbi:hypothetical protein [Secundilactobacillus paracollinoides]|uniref:hypothetical protein n=1 Tax=Secundilactobacillus paracollinoides TaxID=240427 RepID=UPI0006D0876B|nr:hypothetical protein [Secundilactobacillus paracollinoides]KRL76036.1 hypothetical protein FC17_GL002083 [Secundilactobacillus paracollinoides DSM 15502 = JCM 11969]
MAKIELNVSGMAQFGTVLWCRHQLATVPEPVTDVRVDEDPFESCVAEIELASSRATSMPCQIAECNGLSPNTGKILQGAIDTRFSAHSKKDSQHALADCPMFLKEDVTYHVT